MKKIILALAVSSVFAFASETTVNATMSLMTQGMNQVQNGFLYSDKKAIAEGIKTIESANSIFTKVDVSTFIKNNSKIQVTNNINKHLTADLKAFKKALKSENYTDATKQYGKVLTNCIACHKIIRGW